MDCSRSGYSYFGGGVCEYGTCDVATNLCVCNEGFSSTGDWATSPGYTCDLNISIIRGLGIACAVFNFFSACFCFKVTQERYSLLDDTSDDGKKKFWWFFFRFWKYGRSRWIKHWSGAGVDAKILAPTSFFIASTCYCVYGLLKALDPSAYGVGKDYLSSFFNQFGTHYAFYGLTRINSILLTYCIKQLKTVSTSLFMGTLIRIMHTVVSL